jgi:VIT1/CCC1 family predicted Fe2+/Mn2+ transporter
MGKGGAMRKMPPAAPPGHQELSEGVQTGTARAGVFGISDGLVTNVSLILGVAGATPAPGIVRLAGIASLLAGAFSMAAGEYISVTAQRELVLALLEKERRELEEDPEGELRELEMIYERRGLAPEVAAQVAVDLMRDPELALQTHAREELGIDPTVIGTPLAAASSSFILFAVGAALPLLPWLFLGNRLAIRLSIVISAVAALAIGAILARFTGRSPVVSALRQLAVATAAAGVTYAVGTALGVTVG